VSCAEAVEKILAERAGGPRTHRNMLVFVAPDIARLEELRDAARAWLAWSSVLADKVELNLDGQQTRHAETQIAHFDEMVAQRIGETFVWMLAPRQEDPKASEVEWEAVRVTGSDPIPVRVARKLRNEEGLVVEYAGTRLRLDLDRVPLWRGEHVSTQQLWSDYTQFLYLSRLRDRTVLIRAIEAGAADMGWEQDTFAYAQGFDEDKERHLGLVAGSGTTVLIDGSSVVVMSEVARKQLDSEAAEAGETEVAADGDEATGGEGVAVEVDPVSTAPRRFYGAVELDPVRLSRDASQVADEVVKHLAGLVDADVEVRLEISATREEGFPDEVVRTVTENSQTLKFDQHGFEES